MRWTGVLAFLAVVAICGFLMLTGPAGRIELTLVVSPTTESIEGDVAYVEFAGLASEVELDAGANRMTLLPGHHELTGFVRNCNGNCLMLGDPKNHCNIEFDGAADEAS